MRPQNFCDSAQKFMMLRRKQAKRRAKLEQSPRIFGHNNIEN